MDSIGDGTERNFNEYTPQLGRRFRALKLWIVLRWFGLDGLRRRIRHHLALAQEFAGWVDADAGLGAARPGAVLDGLLPARPAGPRRRRRRRSTPTTRR